MKHKYRLGLLVAVIGWVGVSQNCDIVISSSVSRIVLASTIDDTDDRYYDIVVMSENGSRYRNLTKNIPVSVPGDLSYEQNPSICSDGSRIAFTFRGYYTDYEIGVINMDGSSFLALTNNSVDDIEPQISPDGTKVLYLNGGNIYVVDTSGVSSPTVIANGISPVWSPDGRKIAYASLNNVYYMKSDGSDFPGLNVSDPSMAYSDSSPAFSPDGRKIAFVSSRPNDNGQNDVEIYSVNVDGTNLVQITHNADSDDLPLWSPNGRKIAFMGNSAGMTAICSVIADGQSPIQQLTTFTNYLNSKYRWSPDSRQIIFQSERDGNLEIYIMNADGTNQRPVKAFPASDEIDPVWCFE